MTEDIKKGLLGIVVDETEVSKVMPEINSLTYRGYAAQDLCAKCKFEEVAYLILNGELPNKKQLKNFEKNEKKERRLSKSLLDSIKNFPKKSHPMDVARTAVSIMGLEDKETKDNSPNANMRKVMRIFAKTPTALAAFYRLRKGKKIINPKNNLSFSENFFYMCFGKVPNKEIVKAFDVSLILYAEHSFNVSTFTARTITSSLSDIHGAITGAIASLKGPLHGGANEEVMHMMNKIKKPENALKWINTALDKKSVVMGFGHRVYKNFDPRAKIIKVTAHEVLKDLGIKDPILNIAKSLEKEALNDPYFTSRKLYPNVDFYSGIIYKALNIPTEMFTVMFALGRVPGWIAHWREMRMNNDPIGRPRQVYTGSKKRDFLPLKNR